MHNDLTKLKELAERALAEEIEQGYRWALDVDPNELLGLIAEVERLRSALEAFVLRADAYLGAGRDMPDVSMEVALEKARAALEGGAK